jgi:hypothetical protein
MPLPSIPINPANETHNKNDKSEPINHSCQETESYPISNSPFLNPFSNEDSRSSEIVEEKKVDANEEFKGLDPFLPPSYAPVMKNAVVLQPL